MSSAHQIAFFAHHGHEIAVWVAEEGHPERVVIRLVDDVGFGFDGYSALRQIFCRVLGGIDLEVDYGGASLLGILWLVDVEASPGAIEERHRVSARDLEKEVEPKRVAVELYCPFDIGD